MSNKKMVADLADTVRDDATANPQNFPAGSAKSFKKASDEEVAQWFLENIDRIEKAGYEGTVYSRDGINNEWIARRYIAGSHNWEDITGVMNMNLRDWYLLKNRGLLGAGHTDIPKFSSVRDIGAYINSHYENHMKDAREAAKAAAMKKSAKIVKLVDNEDYKVYTVLNRTGSLTIGLGSQWCTANSSYAGHYNTYSNRAMLFQLIPTQGEKDEKGRSEKYQFDAGGPTFMDVLDRPVSAETVREKFPYLYTDLVKALRGHKAELEKEMEDLSADALYQTPDTKIKVYKIDDEIKKLEAFVTSGYFTDKVRPKVKPQAEPAAGQQQPAEEPPEQQGNPTMEEVDKDVAAMLGNLKKYDMLKESIAPVLEKKKDKKPEWLEKKEIEAEEKEGKKGKKPDPKGEDLDEGKWSNQDKPEDHFKSGFDKVKDKLTGKDKKDDKKDVKEAEECPKCHEMPCECDKEDMKEGADPEVLSWMKRFASLGNMKGYGR